MAYMGVALTTLGFSVELYGYYLPFMLICGILNAIASGLLSLLSPTTPTSKWIGYQILLGIGRGFGLSVVSALPSKDCCRFLHSPSYPKADFGAPE